MIKANISDLLILGSGISGLSYALKVAEQLPDIKITILTKNNVMEANTNYAQGGISVVLDQINDSYEKHIQDTLIAGDGLCDEEVVRFVVEEGPKRFKEIIDWGARFDKNEDNSYNLGKEGGHTENRVAHFKDITGNEMERVLYEKVKSFSNIQILEYHYAIDLITEHHIKEIKPKKEITCFGAYALNKSTKKIETFVAKITIMAMGGAGQVYEYTTNPLVATGDGIGMAFRAKAKIKHMQYYQFHPTALYGVSNPAFLISEAVRGFGAKLITKDGNRFLHEYDEREELASRDIVARAIDSELKISGDPFVCLDCRQLDKKEFLEHFPNIYEKCLSIGIDCFKDLIPVVPAAHYMCGGVETDENGKTNLKNLYAIGEITCSGLHGANRLASNSLLEGLVFGHRAAAETIKKIPNLSFDESINKIPKWNEEGMKLPEEMVLINYLRKDLRILMNDLVGIVRTNARLQLASQKLEEIFKSVKELYKISVLTPQLAELRNLIDVAYLIIQESIKQTENRGAFYNKDLEK
jgi:L-aspartate oxidase